MLRRAVAKVARGEAVRPVAPGDISRKLGFELSSSLADQRREKILAEAHQSLLAADASVGKSERESESEEPESEDTESTLDAGFEDATWAEDGAKLGRDVATLGTTLLVPATGKPEARGWTGLQRRCQR